MTTKRVLSFPLPFEDETVFSLVSRFHVLHAPGQGSSKATLRVLFGAPGVVLRTGLPGRLERLAETFPEGYPLDAAALIERHTTFPYFRPFLSEERQAGIEEAMRSTDARGIKATLGMLASGSGAREPLRFCPVCAQEDMALRGQPYWRRAHQLAGTLVCLRHASSLFERKEELHRPNRHGLFLPPLNADPSLYAPCLTETQRHLVPRLASIAKINAGILTSAPGTFSGRKLRRIAIAKMYSLGLRKRRLLLDHRDAAKWLAESHGRLSEFGDFAFLRRDRIEGWLYGFLRTDRAASHPLRYAVLVDALFGDLASALAYPDPMLEDGQGAPPRAVAPPFATGGMPSSFTSPAERRAKSPWDVSLHGLLVEKRMSLRAAAKVVGKTVTTVRVHAERQGIPVDRRPKHVNPEIEAEILETLEYASTRTSIAERTGVSASTVSRFFASHPEAHTRWIEKLKRARTDKAMVQIVFAPLGKPHWGRKQIRQAHPASYTWLYRHERPWLENYLSGIRKPERGRRRRIDWEERDRVFSERIREAARRLLELPGKPVRLTRTALARAAGCLAVIEKKPERLSCTRELLETLCESDKKFRLRRVHWAARALRERGKVVSAWRIRRMAGLNPTELPDVELAIGEIVSKSQDGKTKHESPE